ncbi:MAG TPA: polysialyltransferase family glycosyltransferase [Ohtaekwangia sp.]|uniref:polysialyltransferase family glycosyltransferase n=1 Tax=Ohtaekwangia sp. TaxID=2066019 RepID=UPI002F942BA0
MKKKILLVWPYRRADWIEVFDRMKDDFDFVFLSVIHPSFDEVQPPSYAEIIYWYSFQNAQDVLNKVAPDKIIFMSLDSALSIALNIAAKSAGIRTYILQHGIYSNYKDYRVRERQWRKKNVVKKVDAVKREVKFSSVSFLVKSLKPSQRWMIVSFVLYTYWSRKKGYYWASRYFSFSGKIPTYFLCFSPRNATIHKQIEKPRVEQLLYIGSPELDKFLVAEQPVTTDKFYLHIDQAFAEHSLGEELVSQAKMTDFYQTLNAFCKSHQAKLYIKLHPESYRTSWFPQDENIVYLKHTPNLSAYVQQAEGCFGFYSTMVIPAIYWKKVILFRLNYSFMQEQIEALKTAPVLNFWNFRLEDISFDFEKENMEKFKLEFFYKTDGQSLQRLKDFLNA